VSSKVSSYTPAKQPEGYCYFQVFKEDVVFANRSKFADIKQATQDNQPKSTRGEIKSFSKKSRLRLIHQLRNSQHHFKQFITLTYPKQFPTDGKEVKSHLNAFLTMLRQSFNGIHYAWVFEAQSRGAPHFHIILNVELPNQRQQDRHGQYFHSAHWSKCWSRITGNESNPKHLRHGLRIDPITDGNSKALAGYMAKYYSKNEQKQFNNNFSGIGRYWGASRGFTMPLMEGIYKAAELKWKLKLCFHYANIERAKAGYRRYSYSTDRGCSIWNMTEIFKTKIGPNFMERLDNPFREFEKPPKLTLDKYVELLHPS